MKNKLTEMFSSLFLHSGLCHDAIKLTKEQIERLKSVSIC